MGVSLTPAALERVRALQQEHGLGPGHGLRIAVLPGQSGAERFALELSEGPSERDRCWKLAGVDVFCDPRSYLYLGELEVDWLPERGGFWIRERAR
jgi:Fe-S cluster assembly iron-binding protein IscA